MHAVTQPWMRVGEKDSGAATPQAQIVGLMRSLFADRVLTSPMVKSTAVSDAGLTKETLYEVGRENFTRATYDRAMESMNAVNAEIEGLILQAWGRGT